MVGGGGYGRPSVGAVWSWGRSGLLTFRAPSGAQSHWGQKGREESERAVPGAPLCGPAEGLGAAAGGGLGLPSKPLARQRQPRARGPLAGLGGEETHSLFQFTLERDLVELLFLGWGGERT